MPSRILIGRHDAIMQATAGLLVHQGSRPVFDASRIHVDMSPSVSIFTKELDQYDLRVFLFTEMFTVH